MQDVQVYAAFKQLRQVPEQFKHSFKLVFP
jgi:hypothetical protein